MRCSRGWSLLALLAGLVVAGCGLLSGDAAVPLVTGGFAVAAAAECKLWMVARTPSCARRPRARAVPAVRPAPVPVTRRTVISRTTPRRASV